ncbi:DUF4115 domain-containing protein [candidate division KSB1 bacterium]|nr:DUF4115 domain-containing protein [candidate division KSB1 bacterium]
MPSKAEGQAVLAGGDANAAAAGLKPDNEFERLRALLLEDALAQLQEVEEENLRLKHDQRTILARHEQLAEAHFKLAQDKDELILKHARLLDELLALRLKIEDKESFTSSLEPVIANTLERKIASSGEEMAEVVAPLMAPAIKKQIHESKDEMVEALHPIIGQTVKRAVAEAMRRLVQQINQRLDRAFNMQGTWRRVKARLTGMPEPLAVLPQVLPFGVDEIFLIARKTGLLMAHVSANVQTESDPKAQMVSSMLTAIQDFIKDAFGEQHTSDLHEFRHGEGITFVIASPMLLLAAVTKGETPHGFSKLLERLLSKIQNSCYHAIVNFEGDTAEIESARLPMQKFIHSFALGPAPQKQAGKETSLALKIAWSTAGVLTLALLAWFIFKPSTPTAPAPPTLEATVSTLPPGVSPFRLEARTSGEVWIRFFQNETDSTTFRDFRFHAGETYAWRATGRIRLRVGNAGQTELYLDGKNLGELGAVYQPVTLIIAHEGLLEKK